MTSLMNQDIFRVFLKTSFCRAGVKQLNAFIILNFIVCNYFTIAKRSTGKSAKLYNFYFIGKFKCYNYKGYFCVVFNIIKYIVFL